MPDFYGACALSDLRLLAKEFALFDMLRFVRDVAAAAATGPLSYLKRPSSRPLALIVTCPISLQISSSSTL